MDAVNSIVDMLVYKFDQKGFVLLFFIDGFVVVDRQIFDLSRIGKWVF